MTFPFVSIIIPVLNNVEQLESCVTALQKQTYPRHLYEIIVIDNGSSQSAQKRLRMLNNIVLAIENFPTQFAARNKGILLAKGQVFAFTDADCIPTSDWIEKGVRHLLNTPECGIVAGKFVLYYKKANQPNVVELYETLTAFDQKRFIEEWKFGATGNLFTFKKVLEDVGRFDHSLKSGGDVEFGRRVHAAGYRQIYSPQTRVWHPSRASLGQLMKRQRRIIGGLHDFNKQSLSPIKPFVNVLIRDYPTFHDFLSLFSDGRIHGLQQRFGLFVLTVIVKFTRMAEFLRLRMGGVSNRW